MIFIWSWSGFTCPCYICCNIPVRCEQLRGSIVSISDSSSVLHRNIYSSLTNESSNQNKSSNSADRRAVIKNECSSFLQPLKLLLDHITVCLVESVLLNHLVPHVEIVHFENLVLEGVYKVFRDSFW